MQEHNFYSDPKTQKVIFTTKKYTSTSGDECMRSVCCHNYENPDLEYACAASYFYLGKSFKMSSDVYAKLDAISNKLKAENPNITREQYIEGIVPLGEELKNDMTSGNFVFYQGAPQANPFFKISAREKWKHVTPDNATDYERKQVEYMIQNSPARGKHHALMEDCWACLQKQSEEQNKKAKDAELHEMLSF